jgi:cell wall-associated NlpC family hydrolase
MSRCALGSVLLAAATAATVSAATVSAATVSAATVSASPVSAATAPAGPASAAAAASPSHQGPAARTLVGQQIAAYAATFVGRYRYKWGGESPQTGFDCSGLTSYVYAHYGMAIARSAEAQFRTFRQVPSGKEWRGDLVFFHDTSGYVYHVGIYEGGGTIVAAADQKEGIVDQAVGTTGVTFGTITH